MPLFRRKASRQVTNEPYPDYDDTRWRYHLRTNAIETDHFCNEYVETINVDRKEAARLFKNNDESRARIHAESALRNKRIVTALGALSPLSNALYQRSEPLAGYTSLAQVPEPARSGVVTIIFASAHLDLKYLSETVNFLRSQFSPVHIEEIQRSEGELAALVNPSVRDALATGPPLRSEVDVEIASAVKEYFGVSLPPAQIQQPPPHETGTGSSKFTDNPLPSSESEAIRNSQTTPLSAKSSDIGGPLSPQLAAQERCSPQHDSNIRTPSPPRVQSSQTSKMFSKSIIPASYAQEGAALEQEFLDAGDAGYIQRDHAVSTQHVERINAPSRPAMVGTTAEMMNSNLDTGVEHAHLLHERTNREVLEIPEYLRSFEDSDEMVLVRYEQLRSVISV